MEELIKIQSELKAPKNQRNNFGNYNYRNAEGILEAVKPLLLENGCLLTLNDSLVLIGNRFYVKATASFTNASGHNIQVDGYAREEESKKGMDGSQITGSSSSFARKYALNGLFLIDDTKDSDFTNTHDKEPKKEVTKPVLELGTENFNNCKKAYLADNKVLPKIMAKYEMSDEVHSALILE
jgi:hypothetical protein